MTNEIAVGAAAYLIGSVPSGYLLGRLHRIDVRSSGSGNIGATNVARSVGTSAGVLTLGIDMAKGALPVLLVDLLDSVSSGSASPAQHLRTQIVAALFAVGGHVFSVFLRFRGGKGVATTLGALAALAPAVALVAVAAFGITLAATRIVSLASLVATAAAPIGAVLLGSPGGIVAACAALALLIAARHHENLARLRAGTEPRIGVARQS